MKKNVKMLYRLMLLSVMASILFSVSIHAESSSKMPTYIMMKKNQTAIYTDGKLQKLCTGTSLTIELDKKMHGYVPVSCMADVLNIRSSGTKSQFVFYIHNRKVKIRANERAYTVDGKGYVLSYEPFIASQKLYISIRDIARIASYKVVNLSGVYIYTHTDYTPHVRTISKALLEYENKLIKIPVLTYHHFSTEQNSNLIVQPDLFEQQMKYLKDNGYTTLSDEDLLKIYSGKMQIPDKPIFITMDDGYESNYKVAYPILKKYNFKATVFLIVRRIADQHHEQKPYTYLDWNQIKEMSESGLVSFQSHTYNLHFIDPMNNLAAITHPMMINGKLETDQAYDKRVLDDLALSRTIIEQKTGKRVISFAYPFGHHNKHTEELLKQAGFQFSFTVRSGYNSIVNGPFSLKRISVPGTLKVGDLQIPSTIDQFGKMLENAISK